MPDYAIYRLEHGLGDRKEGRAPAGRREELCKEGGSRYTRVYGVWRIITD